MEKLAHDSYEDLCRKFDLKAPEDFNVAFALLDKIAQSDPNRLCIRHVDDAENTRDISFKELNDAASRVANALKEKGIRKGDRVMLVLYRRLEWWESMLGLHKLGAVAIPAPSQLTAHDIEYRLNKAHVKAVIVDGSISASVQEVKDSCKDLFLMVQAGSDKLLPGWTNYDQMLSEASDNFPRPSNPAELASGKDPLLIFFSSGTTGMPKMVLHNHFYALGHAFTGVYWHDLVPGDIHLTVADTGWGKAIWGKSYGQWMAGAAVFVYDYRGKFEPTDLLRVMTNGGVTSFCAPPTIYRFMVREDLTKYDLSKLKHCTTAGELLNASVFEDWKRITGLSLHEGYGQTETTLQIVTLPCMEPKPGSIGKPAPGWDILLLREDGTPVPAGEEGEICIRVSNGAPIGLFDGYLDEPERTAKAMHDGWYHTGDKAWVDEDGYFWFLGRVDDLIKSSGYRIGPFEVESALVAHVAVVEAAVTGVPDPVRGQVIKATIVLAPGYEPSAELTKELQDYVKKYTAPYKYPRVVEYVKELPKTISGKIKRADIRAEDERKA